MLLRAFALLGDLSTATAAAAAPLGQGVEECSLPQRESLNLYAN
jgi:hypothetical protein